MCIHRGHGHVRPEVTDEARRGGRIKKVYNNSNNSDNGASNELDGSAMMVIHVRRYMTKITTLNCYIRYNISVYCDYIHIIPV